MSLMKSRALPIALLVIGLLSVVSGVAFAISPKQEGNSFLESIAFISERLQAQPSLDSMEDVETALEPGVRNGWANFRRNVRRPQP